MEPWFNVRKAAQVAAFFALKQSGKINVLKVTKLVYLSERRFLDLYEATLLNDKLVSMPHGPVNSLTYNCISGQYSELTDWSDFIQDKENYNISLTNPDIRVSDLDELSDAEIEVMQEVWDTFGGMDRYQIRDWTHINCLEWEDPHGSSTPIPYKRVFGYLGKQDADELDKKVEAERLIAKAFA